MEKIRWGTEYVSCIELTPTLWPAVTETELWGRAEGSLICVRNKSWKLRGGCHFTLSNTMFDVHCASSHGSCTPLRASLLLVGWNPQGNKTSLISRVSAELNPHYVPCQTVEKVPLSMLYCSFNTDKKCGKMLCKFLINILFRHYNYPIRLAFYKTKNSSYWFWYPQHIIEIFLKSQYIIKSEGLNSCSSSVSDWICKPEHIISFFSNWNLTLQKEHSSTGIISQFIGKWF